MFESPAANDMQEDEINIQFTGAGKISSFSKLEVTNNEEGQPMFILNVNIAAIPEKVVEADDKTSFSFEVVLKDRKGKTEVEAVLEIIPKPKLPVFIPIFEEEEVEVDLIQTRSQEDEEEEKEVLKPKVSIGAISPLGELTLTFNQDFVVPEAVSLADYSGAI
mmetsp:Transcript_30839/g.47237  ORF Transcript_30839/g.47237 Transcript_30839/m.47237 type:complete len:163 (-) Transcript_30839:97-585(-)